MHLILFIDKKYLNRPELAEFKLPESNPHGRLNSNKIDKVSLTTDELTSPEYFQAGTLYAYIQVIGDDEDPRATLRVKEEDLYPVIRSLGRRFKELWDRKALRVIPPIPVRII